MSQHTTLEALGIVAPKRRFQFRDVEALEPDDIIRIGGGDEVVDHIERSPDRHHWRIYLVGCARAVIVPPTARFTLVHGAHSRAAVTAAAQLRQERV